MAFSAPSVWTMLWRTEVLFPYGLGHNSVRVTRAHWHLFVSQFLEGNVIFGVGFWGFFSLFPIIFMHKYYLLFSPLEPWKPTLTSGGKSVVEKGWKYVHGCTRLDVFTALMPSSDSPSFLWWYLIPSLPDSICKT